MSITNKKISIKSELVRMQLLLAFFTIFFCTIAFFANDLLIFRRSVERSFETTAKILNRNLAPVLAFFDQAEATKILASLQSEPSIVAAYVFTNSGQLFAKYGSVIESKVLYDANFKMQKKSRIQGSHFIFLYQLGAEGESLGYLYLDGNLKIIAKEYKNYFWIILMVFILGLILSYLLANLMQRALSKPIINLAKTTKSISDSGDYTLRMNNGSGGRVSEIEALSSEFNHMLDQIQSKDEKIRSANVELERKVEERTAELSKTQALLFQSSKMTALGEISGGIAHEINTPLAVIQMGAEQLQELVAEEPLDPSAIVVIAQKIQTTVARIASIVKGLRSFSRDGSQASFQITPLHRIVEDTLALCSEKFKNNRVELRVSPMDKTIDIECKAAQPSQVLLNLINNAYDAIEHLDKKWVQVDVADLGETIEIRVTDSGSGIPKNVQEKLFQPFFTTKEIGKGTGLGVSISKNIMESHQGSLTLNNDCPNTQFVMRLPKRQK